MSDALDFLRGTWQVRRRLTDHRLGVAGWFRGTARFEPRPEPRPSDNSKRRPSASTGRELVYHEEGELSFNGHAGPASRSLIFRAGPDGTAEVSFADGREFYRLDPRGGPWQARHPCGRDEYELLGRALGPDRFDEHWRVRGPDKDYEIMTTLTRADAGDPP